MSGFNWSEMFGDSDSDTNESILTPERHALSSKKKAKKCNFDSHIAEEAKTWSRY